MITFIVVACVVCIALFMLNKKGILGFVLLFGLLGASGSDFLYYFGMTILGTATVSWIFNMFHPLLLVEKNVREKFINPEKNDWARAAKIILFILYGILTFVTAGSIFGQYMLAQKIGGIDYYFNSTYQFVNILNNILAGINISSFIIAKVWMLYDWIKLRNHRST